MALVAAFVGVALTVAGCGRPPALQSVIETPTPVPTWTAAPAPTAEPLPTATARVVVVTELVPATPAHTATPTEIPTITLTPTPGPSPTPDTRETSAAVFATITALAATPTYPPTSTPRPQRTPIGAGPEDGDVPPTALFVSGDIAVLMLSQQVYPGGAAALTIKTKPAATCTLKIVRGTGGKQMESKLEPIRDTPTRVAGGDGTAAWLWTVAADEPAGIMSFLVDCGAAGKAQVQIRVAE
jgi:hypothetical protein